jgi:predicted nucleic acid-binding protein
VNAEATFFSAVPNAFTWPQHPDDDHLFNLAFHAKAKYLVTWETRILKLETEMTPVAELLRELAPDLMIITPKQLADLVRAPE